MISLSNKNNEKQISHTEHSHYLWRIFVYLLFLGGGGETSDKLYSYIKKLGKYMKTCWWSKFFGALHEMAIPYCKFHKYEGATTTNGHPITLNPKALDDILFFYVKKWLPLNIFQVAGNVIVPQIRLPKLQQPCYKCSNGCISHQLRGLSLRADIKLKLDRYNPWSLLLSRRIYFVVLFAWPF